MTSEFVKKLFCLFFKFDEENVNIIDWSFSVDTLKVKVEDTGFVEVYSIVGNLEGYAVSSRANRGFEVIKP